MTDRLQVQESESSQSVWVVVGVIAYAGDTVVSVWSSEDAATAEAVRLTREGDRVIYDDGYDVRGPFDVSREALDG